MKKSEEEVEDDEQIIGEKWTILYDEYINGYGWQGRYGSMDGYDKAYSKRMSNNKNLFPEEKKMLIRILNNQLDVYNDFEDKMYTEEIEMMKQILMKIS